MASLLLGWTSSNMITFVMRSKAQCYCLCALLGLSACSDPAGDEDASDSGSDLHHVDRDHDAAAVPNADAGTATDSGPAADASTTTEADAGLPTGVVLSPDSSLEISFAGSRASYMPAQPGCNAQYTAIMSVDGELLRAIEIIFGDSAQLDTEYPLQPFDPGFPGREVMNYLRGDDGAIQVNVNGIEGQGVDKVSAGSINFQSLTGNLEFHFSFSFTDGKLLDGTFNLPIKQGGTCPGPTL